MGKKQGGGSKNTYQKYVSKTGHISQKYADTQIIYNLGPEIP